MLGKESLLLKSNDLLILKQQLLFDYNIVQTGTYNNNSEVGGNFSIVGYDSDKCNSISLNGDLYADTRWLSAYSLLFYMQIMEEKR